MDLVLLVIAAVLAAALIAVAITGVLNAPKAGEPHVALGMVAVNRANARAAFLATEARRYQRLADDARATGDRVLASFHQDMAEYYRTQAAHHGKCARNTAEYYEYNMTTFVIGRDPEWEFLQDVPKSRVPRRYRHLHMS